jgi:hypothetical protein
MNGQRAKKEIFLFGTSERLKMKDLKDEWEEKKQEK